MRKPIVLIFIGIIVFAFIIYSALVRIKFAYADWIQTVTGNIHIEGDLDSNVPSGNFLSLEDQQNSGDSGIITYHGNLTNYGNGSQTPSNGADWVVSLNNTSIRDRISKYSYNYYAGQSGILADKIDVEYTVGEGVCSTGDLNGLLLSGQTIKINGNFYIGRKSDGSNCPSGGGGIQNYSRSGIVLVDGDLIVSKEFTVNQANSSIVFIVSGNMYISGDVTGTDKSHPGIRGIFVVDGMIDTNCEYQSGTCTLPRKNTTTLFMDGTYIGLGQIYLSRALPGSVGEVFTYDIDLYLHMPIKMKQARIKDKKEINP